MKDMQYTRTGVVIAGVVLLQAVLTFAGYWYWKKQHRTGYVIAAEVFDRFAYTQEVRAQLKKEQQAMIKIVDSLRTELDLAPPKDATDARIARLNLLSERLNDRSEIIVQEHNNKIWNRINLYTKEYGEKNGYQYIFGANGAGLLMHADSSQNITKEVIQYINQRYNDVH